MVPGRQDGQRLERASVPPRGPFEEPPELVLGLAFAGRENLTRQTARRCRGEDRKDAVRMRKAEPGWTGKPRRKSLSAGGVIPYSALLAHGSSAPGSWSTRPSRCSRRSVTEIWPLFIGPHARSNRSS